MSKQYRIFVQKSLKFFLVFFISSNTFSADEIKINNLLSKNNSVHVYDKARGPGGRSLYTPTPADIAAGVGVYT